MVFGHSVKNCSTKVKSRRTSTKDTQLRYKTGEVNGGDVGSSQEAHDEVTDEEIVNIPSLSMNATEHISTTTSTGMGTVMWINEETTAQSDGVMGSAIKSSDAADKG